MRHLVCVCLCKGRAGRGVRDIVTTGGMSRQPVERIDERSTSAMSVSATEKDPANYSRPARAFSMCWSRAFRNVSRCFRLGVSSVSPENWKRDHGRLAISTELSAANDHSITVCE